MRRLAAQALRQSSSYSTRASQRPRSLRPIFLSRHPISAAPFRRTFATPTDPPKPPPERNDPGRAIPKDESKLPEDVDEKATRIEESETATRGTVDPPPSIDLLAQAEEQQNSRERGERNRDAYKTSIDRRRENVAFYGFLAFPGLLLAGVLVLGQNWDQKEAAAHPDIPNGYSPGQIYTRATTRLSEALGYYTEPAFEKLLPDVDPAYKPPYTLVLSLEDLLVSSKWTRQNGWEVAKRPGVDYFIRYLQQYYELVLFTTVPMMNGEQVYRKLDPFHFIMFPLFREGTRYMNGHHVKDLSYLNRDLSKTIVIDTDANHTQLQPENAVILPKWSGKPGDKHAVDLVALIPFLEYIAGMNIEDVRKVIKSFEGKNIPEEYARREAQAREKFQAEHGTKGRRLPGGGIGGMIGFKPSPQPGQLPGEQSMAEGFAQGKMLIDQVRERGQLQYQHLENEIRQNGQKWLEDMEREEKQMMDEQMKSMKNDWISFPFASKGEQQKAESEKR